MTKSKDEARPGELLADDEYEIEVEELDEVTFEITLKNDAARRALEMGQKERDYDGASTLASALDGTLNAIEAEMTGLASLLWAPVGITGENDGTPNRVTIQVRNVGKRKLIERCGAASGTDQQETVRRLTTLALRLILFETKPAETPDIHPMLAGSTPKTVH